MLHTAARRITVPQQVTCDDSTDARRLARDYRPDAGFTLVIPSEGTILVNTVANDNAVVTFVCRQDRKGWGLVIANILVGLGFYKTTSDVPGQLQDTREDRGQSQYALEWSANGHETICRQLQASV